MRLPEADLVAVDTETSGLHPDDGARVACVAVAWMEDGKLRSLGLPFDQGERDKLPSVQMDLIEGDVDPNLDRAAWDRILAWLKARRLVFTNAKFDLAMLKAGTRHWPGIDLVGSLAWDTMVAARVLDPLENVGLDATAKAAGLEGKQGLEQVTGWLEGKGYAKRRYDLVPWNAVEPYVTSDAELTLGVYLAQVQRLEAGEGDAKRVLREHQLLETLYKMESRGVAYDAGASLEAAEVLTKRANRIEKKMPFKCTAPGAKAYFYGEKGMTPDRLTEKGKPSLDEEQVRAWVAEGVEWAAEYAEVSKARRAVSMWYQGYPDKLGTDGRLRTNYRQTKVKSGRMSVERVQLQAIPKKDKNIAGVPGVRELLRAAPGRGLWNLDLSQAELRVAAEYARCERMLGLLAEGADLHGITCEQVLRVDRSDPEWKEKRDIAKRLTFGSIFQIGGETFQATLAKLADVHLPLHECDKLVYTWRGLYPEFGRIYKKADRMAAGQGWVPILPKTDYEFRSYFGPRDYPNTAWNRIVQGSLAEFFKLWMVEVEAEWPGLMVLTIHDSILLELPLKDGDRIAAEVAAVGQQMATDLFMREESGVIMPVDVDRWV